MHNGCNLTLISPRRYGKTGLIQNVFHRLKEQDESTICCYVDIYATNTLDDFVATLGKAVVGKLESPLQKAGGLIGKVFRNSQITISQDPLSGLPQFGLSFHPLQVENTLDEIFDYLSHADRPCYVAIDEFQQIGEYPEKNVEALLRAHIQQTQNVHFIFSGSKMHMMQEMFNSPKRPFYRSTEKLFLHLLPKRVYYEFASEKMAEKGIILSEHVFDEIYDKVDGVTWFVQSILNRLYRLEPCEITAEQVRDTVNRIVRSEEEDYKRIFHILTLNQSKLLLAIARESVVKEPLAAAFLQKHQLKTPSSMQRALQYLLEHEYIYRSENGYIIYDRFFGLWLRTV